MILDKAAVVLRKDMLTAVRYRNGLLLNVISPLLQLSAFYYLSRAVGPQFRPDGVPYFLFLLIGTGFYTFLFSGMHGMLHSIQEAQQSGILEVLMTTSTRPAVLLCLSALSAFASAFVQLAIYGLAGTLLFASEWRLDFLPAAIVFSLSTLIAVALGMIAAGLQIAMHRGSTALWALGSASWLMAGTLFPVTALPAPVRAISNLIPFRHSLQGMRLALMGSSGSTAVGAEIIKLCLFAVLLLPIGVAFFSIAVRRARLMGTLSFQ